MIFILSSSRSEEKKGCPIIIVEVDFYHIYCIQVPFLMWFIEYEDDHTNVFNSST